MAIADLMSVKRGASAEGPGDKEVVFVTPESLLTFPVASGAVTGIWGVLKAVSSSFSDKGWALAIAVLVGAFIFLINENAQTTTPTANQRLIAGGIALINSFLLAAAALGINAAT